jgi:small subunit ribosomal protein S16
MLKIKLQRVGRKHDPSYRVVVTDRRTGVKSNKHVAIVGAYDTIRKTVNLKINEIKD